MAHPHWRPLWQSLIVYARGSRLTCAPSWHAGAAMQPLAREGNRNVCRLVLAFRLLSVIAPLPQHRDALAETILATPQIKSVLTETFEAIGWLLPDMPMQRSSYEVIFG
jgi:hypothetical protein